MSNSQLPSLNTILKHKVIKYAYKETQRFSTRHNGFHRKNIVHVLHTIDKCTNMSCVYAYEGTVCIYNCYGVELLMKLEEESHLISHDLEDTSATPSEATVELTKSLIDCVERYVNGMY